MIEQNQRPRLSPLDNIIELHIATTPVAIAERKVRAAWVGEDAVDGRDWQAWSGAEEHFRKDEKREHAHKQGGVTPPAD